MRARRTGSQAASAGPPVRRSAILSALSALSGVLRRIAGMPDYEAYVRHLQRAHPGRPVPSEREYFDCYVEARYGDGPTRCC
jgi:uncharacterized short protein YbdD (DUF466 family)